jgi:AraC-like DNA-binding protein
MIPSRRRDRSSSAFAGESHDSARWLGAESLVGYTEESRIEKFEARMAPWDMQLAQLSRGRFHASLRYIKLPGILAYEAQWLPALRTHGATPAGYVMFGNSVDWPDGRNLWCDKTLDRSRFACAGPNSEFSHTTRLQSHHAVMLVDRQLLVAAIGEERVELVCRRKHLQLTSIGGKQLVDAMTEAVRTTNEHPGLLEVGTEVAAIQSRLLQPLVDYLEHPVAACEPTSLRAVAVGWALELADRSSRPMTALELAIKVGVSQRTLEHGFRELLGITPATYLRLHRMNKARRDLSQSDPGSTTVTQVALKWGFTHLGRFSSSYRALFGEAPLHTLKLS